MPTRGGSVQRVPWPGRDELTSPQSATFRAVYSNSAGACDYPQLGVARMSKPRIVRLWFSSACAVPRQSDEALAKSSAR